MAEYYIKTLSEKNWIIYDNNFDILTANTDEEQTDDMEDDIRHVVKKYKIKNLIHVE